MSKQPKKHQSGCLVAFGVDVFGDRWTLLVIRDMLLYGKKTYSEFLEAEENIATNILADRLKLLESEGVVEKSRDPENRRSYIYSLTDKGYALAPVILEIISWSAKYLRLNSVRKDLLHRIEHDRDALLKELCGNQ